MKKIIAVLLALMLLCSAALADTATGRLNQRIATRTGPGTSYTEPGTFLSAGDYVTVHTKVWDSRNEIWWVQVEFTSGGKSYRAYTGSWRMNVDLRNVPAEYWLYSCTVTRDCWSYAGPGSWYVCWSDKVRKGTSAVLYEVENGYGLIECRDQSGLQERVWVDLDHLSVGGYYDDWDDTHPSCGGNIDYGYDDDSYGYDDSRDWCTITVSSGNVRSGAGAEYRALAVVKWGETYEILDREPASNGVIWYQIYCDGWYGWISSGLTNHGKQ